jgi:hypothetical protein
MECDRTLLVMALGSCVAGFSILPAQEVSDSRATPGVESPIGTKPAYPVAPVANLTVPTAASPLIFQQLVQQDNQQRNEPAGATVSSIQARGRLIEDLRPQRIPVYPDDPESAWWEINPSYAFARAQREQRPMMLLFTGAWNTQAMALSEEVFSTKSFNEYVKNNLVICYLNYPRNQTDAPDPLRRIKEKFKVRGYPNVLIFNPSGEVEKGMRGYRTGRPVDYFDELQAACLPVLESIDVRKKQMMRAGFRDWSNDLGREIFARFLKRDTKYVALKDAAGVEWIIRIKDLALKDQKFVESFPRGDKIEIEEDEEP